MFFPTGLKLVNSAKEVLQLPVGNPRLELRRHVAAQFNFHPPKFMYRQKGYHHIGARVCMCARVG